MAAWAPAEGDRQSACAHLDQARAHASQRSGRTCCSAASQGGAVSKGDACPHLEFPAARCGVAAPGRGMLRPVSIMGSTAEYLLVCSAGKCLRASASRAGQSGATAGGSGATWCAPRLTRGHRLGRRFRRLSSDGRAPPVGPDAWYSPARARAPRPSPRSASLRDRASRCGCARRRDRRAGPAPPRRGRARRP